MKNNVLHPDEIMRLYPIEKIESMSDEEKSVIMNSYVKSLIEYSDDKEATMKEIVEITDRCIERKKAEIVEELKKKGFIK